MTTQVAPIQAPTPAPLKAGRGIVKFVFSGDSMLIRGQPRGGPPPEKQVNLSNLTAPKLARRSNPNVPDSVDTTDEAFAWQARETLRKKLIGKEVFFTIEFSPSADRNYGTVYLGKDDTGENINEFMVSEGLVELRKVGVRADNENYKKLVELEEQAKVMKKGKWVDTRPDDAIRSVTWNLENPRNFVDSFKGKPVNAIIEHVRDGSTMRAFLLPSFHHITFMLSGVKCPQIKRDGDKENYEPYSQEAKYFVESRLLHRDVQLLLEGVSNMNMLLATVLHPNGNMTELLLKEGYAHCVDWSITSYSQGPAKLRALEKDAKQRKVRVWANWTPKNSGINVQDKDFTGKVIQIVNADALAIKLQNGEIKTVHLSSIRPPRMDDIVYLKEKGAKQEKQERVGERSRPLYDIPYMFEAREFLRVKLIGKKVNVAVDYIKPSSAATETLPAFPERLCCTVTSAGVNIAEALVSKGLVKVVRHRQDDDSRSAHYDSLLAAEQKAIKSQKGVNSKKEIPIHRVADVSGDVTKAKQFLPFLQRAGKSEAVVEYIFGGSRLKLYLPKETCLITFLLAGIECPRGARNGPGGVMVADPYSDEALSLTKDMCMHREVLVEVESIDRAGNFIGWLFVDGVNMSLALVEHALSKMHFTAERSRYFKAISEAQEKAKSSGQKVWENYEEPVEQQPVSEETERKASYRTIGITEVTSQLHIFCQYIDEATKLDQLMDALGRALAENPPLPGVYKPRRGDFCVGRFTADNNWYRARIEKVESPDRVHVVYIDYGNKEVLPSNRLAALPTEFNTQALLPQAHEMALAFIKVPEDEDSLIDAFRFLCELTQDVQFAINTEYKDGFDHVTLLHQEDRTDIGKKLVSEGYCTVQRRREKRLQPLLKDYYAEQDKAKKQHLNLWRYGDITEDEASEFGYSR